RTGRRHARGPEQSSGRIWRSHSIETLRTAHVERDIGAAKPGSFRRSAAIRPGRGAIRKRTAPSAGQPLSGAEIGDGWKIPPMNRSAIDDVTQEPSAEDQDILYDLLDRALSRIEEGLSVDVEELLTGHDKLRDRALEMIRLASRVGVGSIRSLPTVP